AHRRRLVRHGGALPDAHVLRVGAEALDAEDLVADGELGDGRADRLDRAGELHAEDPLPRPADADEVADAERRRLQPAAVGAGDRRGADADEQIVLLRHRPVDLLEPLHLRRAVPVVDDRLHREPPPFRVRTTLPTFWRVSTYLVASTTS